MRSAQWIHHAGLRERLLHSEQHSSHVHIELFVEMFFGNVPERRKSAGPRVREYDVEVALLLLYSGTDFIQISRLRDVALHGRHLTADLLHRLVQLGLASPCDE